MTINTRLSFATRGLRGGGGINREIFNYSRNSTAVTQQAVSPTPTAPVQITGAGQPIRTFANSQAQTSVKVAANTTRIVWEVE